jgi:tRNA 2-thiouridine synthesizing protein A
VLSIIPDPKTVKEELVMNHTEVSIVVDAKGLACPLPVIKAKKAIDRMKQGEILLLEATDKGSVNDFQRWVKQTRNALIKMEEEHGVYRFFVRKL